MKYSRREPSTKAKAASAAAAEILVAVVPRAMRQIRNVARSATAGLTIPQFRALRFIARNPGIGLTPLAEHLGVTLPGASALVGRLVAAGLIRRETDPGERRRLVLWLTELGQARMAASTEVVHAWWDQALRGLEPAQLAALVAGLEVLDRVTTGADERPATAEIA